MVKHLEKGLGIMKGIGWVITILRGSSKEKEMVTEKLMG